LSSHHNRVDSLLVQSPSTAAMETSGAVEPSRKSRGASMMETAERPGVHAVCDSTVIEGRAVINHAVVIKGGTVEYCAVVDEGCPVRDVGTMIEFHGPVSPVKSPMVQTPCKVTE
jgi:hypothetical protein